ncbi:MAG TPA: glycosyltransferase family 2 protein [Solirubrobacter sp.]|nr:glycosyltransferase family 2 protein [Solirubrobacter sp.]
MAAWWICVLNWNAREDTLRCLASLRGAGAAGVVVADNGSADGSVDAIRAAYPDVDLIANGANLGYSGGNNAAIRHALARGADWVVLLNNDAELEPGALAALAAAPEAGVLAGKLLFPDGRVQWAGQRLDLRTGYSGRPAGFGQPDGPEFSVAGPVPRAVGALMAVSRPAIEAVGLLDDDLFAYVEDVDWCLRIRAAGFACRFVPEARARHRLAGSTGGAAASTTTMYYGTRNTIVVCERRRPFGPIRTALRRATIAGSFLARAVLVQRSAPAVRAVLAGWADARAGRLGPR